MRRNAGNGEVYLLSNLRRAYLATARSTTDHDEIRKWVESKGGHPAQVGGPMECFALTSASPRSTSGGSGSSRSSTTAESKFLYDPEGHMTKFVRDE